MAGEVALDFGGFGEGADNVLHVVRLAADEGAQVDDDALGFVPLAENVFVGVLKGREFLFVALAFSLEFFGNLLLENQSLQRIVALFLGTLKTSVDAVGIIFVLLN